MLTVAIYSKDLDNIETIKESIQDVIIENHIFAKISQYTTGADFLMSSNSFDIYFMDLDLDLDENILNLMNKVLEIDNGASTILFSGDISRGYSAHSLGADYFITKPIGKDNLERIILKIKKKIKEESIVITTGLGDRRIKLNNLNYINIEGRCLCYHLKDGSLLDGKTLRTNFREATKAYAEKQGLYLIGNNLLINLEEIKYLNQDHIIFDNDEKLYYPQKYYESLKTDWKNYIE